MILWRHGSGNGPISYKAVLPVINASGSPRHRRPANRSCALFTGTLVTELAEPDYGIWAGRSLREVMTQDAEAFRAWFRVTLAGRRVARTAAGALWRSWLAKHVDIQGRHCAIAPAAIIRAMIVDVPAPHFTHLHASTSTR